MRTTNITIEKAQLGWVCTWYFAVRTDKQFSDVFTTVQDSSRSVLVAFIKGWWRARKEHSKLKARPGAREAKGWV